MRNVCEMCNEPKPVKWWLLDNNAECLLCDKCVKELKETQMVDVDPIDAEWLETDNEDYIGQTDPTWDNGDY